MNPNFPHLPAAIPGILRRTSPVALTQDYVVDWPALVPGLRGFVVNPERPYGSLNHSDVYWLSPDGTCGMGSYAVSRASLVLDLREARGCYDAAIWLRNHFTGPLHPSTHTLHQDRDVDRIVGMVDRVLAERATAEDVRHLRRLVLATWEAETRLPWINTTELP